MLNVGDEEPPRRGAEEGSNYHFVCSNPRLSSHRQHKINIMNDDDVILEEKSIKRGELLLNNFKFDVQNFCFKLPSELKVLQWIFYYCECRRTILSQLKDIANIIATLQESLAQPAPLTRSIVQRLFIDFDFSTISTFSPHFSRSQPALSPLDFTFSIHLLQAPLSAERTFQLSFYLKC